MVMRKALLVGPIGCASRLTISTTRSRPAAAMRSASASCDNRDVGERLLGLLLLIVDRDDLDVEDLREALPCDRDARSRRQTIFVVRSSSRLARRSVITPFRVANLGGDLLRDLEAVIIAPTIEKATGRKTLNMSYNGLSTEALEIIFADYLEHNPPPKLVIYEVSGFHSPPAALENLKPYLHVSPGLSRFYAREKPLSSHALAASRLFSPQLRVVLEKSVLFEELRSGLDLSNRDVAGAGRKIEASGGVFLPGRDYEDRNLAALGPHDRFWLRIKDIELHLVFAPLWPDYRQRICDWPKVLERFKSNRPGKCLFGITRWPSIRSATLPIACISTCAARRI